MYLLRLLISEFGFSVVLSHPVGPGKRAVKRLWRGGSDYCADHFSGPGRAVYLVCVCVSVSPDNNF